jgi:CRISPR-associated protein Cas2
MKYFICYDISSDHWREKTARLLEEQGCRRVQKSIFAAVDFSPRELTRLQQQLKRRILPHLLPSDSLLCLPVENDLVPAISWHGDNGALAAALEQVAVKII